MRDLLKDLIENYCGNIRTLTVDDDKYVEKILKFNDVYYWVRKKTYRRLIFFSTVTYTTNAPYHVIKQIHSKWIKS